MIGNRYHRLTVIALSDEKRRRQPVWLCRCDCGNETTVCQMDLTRGDTKSCGCWRREQAAQKGRDHQKHGRSYSETYRIWIDMKVRCNNSNNRAFRWYGARGITVCARWNDFASFLADMGERPEGLTLERMDNSMGYAPQNCKWATRKEQAQNRRNPVRAAVQP